MDNRGSAKCMQRLKRVVVVVVVFVVAFVVEGWKILDRL